MRYVTFVGGVASMLLVSGASGQWSDNFDSYADGTVLDGVGGWEGWDGDGSVAATVTSAQSRSGPHSVVVTNNDDAVHQFSGYTSGQWTFTAYQYVPSGLDGPTYYLVQNVYNHGGPYDWAVQLVFDPATDEVHEDMQDFYGSGSNYVTAVYDQWVEIRSEIDLDTNYVETYYNGELVASGDWDTNLDGEIAIANLDLYAPHAASVYYDDISLQPAGGDCFADFDGNDVVDTRDVISFLNAWNAGDAASDCDGNSIIDTRDVICFLNAWNAGC
jgi:hypothetical protein